jgi:hypothetical protein
MRYDNDCHENCQSLRRHREAIYSAPLILQLLLSGDDSRPQGNSLDNSDDGEISSRKYLDYTALENVRRERLDSFCHAS